LKLKVELTTVTKSEDALRQAFAGESQANRKYAAFASRADKESYPQAARLFRAAAEAEAVHAGNHLRAMNGIGSTADNLREALAGETTEFKEMYPRMIEIAKAEGNKVVEITLSYANEVEKAHARLYQNLMDKLDYVKEAYPYYVCPVCGMTVEREAPEICPVCGAKGELFKRID
jgi:rubrerythrin